MDPDSSAPPLGPVRVVGAGLAGIALADALLQRGIPCVLLDRVGIGAGASGAATGLLHPLPGLRAIPGWRAAEAFRMARLSVERRAQRTPQIIAATGVFRPSSSLQREDFLRASREGWGIWCSGGPPCSVPQALAREGLWLAEGCVVNVPLYLQTWVAELVERGLELQFGQPIEEADPAQTTVWCTGHVLASRLPFACSVVRGQALEIEPLEEQERPTLSCGIAGRAYLAPLGNRWIVGATFEHHAPDSVPDLARARQALSARVEELWPGGRLLDQPVQRIHLGHRLSTPDHYPIAGQLPDQSWVWTGLGSRGLLYHVLGAHELAEALIHQDPSRIPEPLSLQRFGNT
jgi:glycine oxidase